MELQLSILNTSDKPIYRQLYDQLASQVVTGQLECGYCLPPIRALAASLGISVISIKRAWEELERDGFIVTMVGRGCFVADMSEHELGAKRREFALSALQAFYKQIAALDIKKEELIELINESYR